MEGSSRGRCGPALAVVGGDFDWLRQSRLVSTSELRAPALPPARLSALVVPCASSASGSSASVCSASSRRRAPRRRLALDGGALRRVRARGAVPGRPRRCRRRRRNAHLLVRRRGGAVLFGWAAATVIVFAATALMQFAPAPPADPRRVQLGGLLARGGGVGARDRPARADHRRARLVATSRSSRRSTTG